MSKKNQTVAVIEDDETLLGIYLLVLKQAGFKTIYAQDGESALDLIKNKKPHLVLLDLMMPGMHGDEVLKILRTKPWGKKTKVIILTNIGYSETTTDLRQYDVLDIIIKVDKTPQEIADLVESHL